MAGWCEAEIGATDAEEFPGEYADFDKMLLFELLASQTTTITATTPSSHKPADEPPDG